MPSISDKGKEEIISLIKEGKTLPKEYIYKLFADDEDVFLFWNGRSEEVTNVVLPFHSIEHTVITQVDVLGFEFEMGLLPHIEDEMKQRGVNLKLNYIPREVFDKRAVDFDYANKKEIIRVGKGDDAKEVCTGNYIFENEWQSFRTKKNPDIELESAWHEYENPPQSPFAKGGEKDNPTLKKGGKGGFSGNYKIAMKVVDILGQDTTQVVEVKI